MGGTIAQLPIGQRVSLPGYFHSPVVLKAARPLAKGFECRVCVPDGTLDEAVISEQEPDLTSLMIQKPAKHLDSAKNEVAATRLFGIPAAAIERAIGAQHT